MDQAAPLSNVLAYADLPARHGIQYDRCADGVLIVLPPPAWWRRPEVLAVIVATPLVMIGPIEQASRSSRAADIAIAAAVPLVTIVIAVLLARVRRTVRIEVTAATLELENIALPGWTENASKMLLRYPRQRVYDAQFVRHSGNIVIRVHGSEMIEFSPIPDTKVKEWIAAELRRALGLPA